MKPSRNSTAAFALVAALTACGSAAKLDPAQSIGPQPVLPKPEKALIPVFRVARATGWPAGAQPTAGAGMTVTAFATGLQHPRWLYVMPNGDVLVAESNAPPKPPGLRNKNTSGIRGWFAKKQFQKAGAAVPSANRIMLLRDANGDGVAEFRSILIANLTSPFGMALVGPRLYIANADAIVSVPYNTGDTVITTVPVKLTDLPAGINHHWTKNIIASQDGTALFATVGSNSNVAENGLAMEKERAAIWRIDLTTGTHRIFASGLRNPNGLAWEQTTGTLWTVVNERDELGSDLVPDYLTSVHDGAFYGWPYSYWGQHVDDRVKPPQPDSVAIARKPDYALGTHVAPLGLVVSSGSALTAQFTSGMFVGLHGSWNRSPRSGYKVIFVPFAAGQPAGPPVDVLTGFLASGGEARGRPVGLAIGARGGLFVADDVGNTIWRVIAAR
jgi:glucose/arabinose dehydrogenase